MTNKKEIKNAASIMSRVGGRACLKKHGKKFYRDMIKKRWADEKKREAQKPVKK